MNSSLYYSDELHKSRYNRRTLTYEERQKKNDRSWKIRPQPSQVYFFTSVASKDVQRRLLGHGAPFSPPGASLQQDRYANPSQNTKCKPPHQGALNQTKCARERENSTSVMMIRMRSRLLYLYRFNQANLAYPSRPRVFTLFFYFFYFTFFLLTWSTSLQGVSFLRLGVHLQNITLGSSELQTSLNGPTCHPELHRHHNKGRYLLSMMWTPYSHVHVTFPPSGSRGYVFLQGVARPLRNDHSLSISKTMSGRRSHHLPRPSLGCLVPDQAYLVPNQVCPYPQDRTMA